MSTQYLRRHLPMDLARKILTRTRAPIDLRRFCANYAHYSSAIKHFSVEELLFNPELWLVRTPEAQTRQNWLHEAYPSNIQQTVDDITESILQCGKCKQRKVDYYQKQTRGADEPMTCFCHCLNCGNRWIQ